MRSRSAKSVIGAVGAALVLAACGGSGGNGSSSEGEAGGQSADPEAFTVLTANENPTIAAQLDELAADQCKAENEALPLEHQNVAQADVVQKVTLLASQDALPTHFIAGTDMVRPSGDLGSAGLVLDYKEALTESGAWENILPAAASSVESVYGHMVSLPYQYNIEGIWYNKAIFDEVGVSVPTTYDELLDVSEKLLDAGYTPMAQPGSEQWPVTRLIGMHAFRALGVTAMQDIKDDNASLTDEAYVAAAEAVAEYAQAGYFGEGFLSVDASAANNAFLTGKAAMKYDGSWLLDEVNNPENNQVGAENIGIFPYPDVAGGAGSSEDWPANAGTAQATDPNQYGPKVAAWIDCIAENYGAQALQDAGVISGFKVNGEVSGVAPATEMVQQTVAEISNTVLWFEALMDAKSTSLAQSNVSLLTTGQMSAEDYMAALQKSIEENR